MKSQYFSLEIDIFLVAIFGPYQLMYNFWKLDYAYLDMGPATKNYIFYS